MKKLTLAITAIGSCDLWITSFNISKIKEQSKFNNLLIYTEDTNIEIVEIWPYEKLLINEDIDFLYDIRKYDFLKCQWKKWRINTCKMQLYKYIQTPYISINYSDVVGHGKKTKLNLFNKDMYEKYTSLFYQHISKCNDYDNYSDYIISLIFKQSKKLKIKDYSDSSMQDKLLSQELCKRYDESLIK